MKKRVLAGTLAAILCGGGTAAAEDWPGYRGGGTQNLLAASDPGGDIDTLWTSGPRNGAGCIAVRDGRLYAVAPVDGDPFNSQLSRVNAATGAVEWTTPPFRNGANCPAVDGRHVYVTRWDDVAAYDVRDGSLAWRWDEGDPYGAPVVAGGAVYLGGYGDYVVGDRYGKRLALDADDGDLRWERYADEAASTPPLVVGDRVIFASWSSGLTAYDAATGDERWSAPGASASTAHDGVVYSATGHYWDDPALVAQDARTGDELWTTAMPYGQMAGALVADGQRLYARTGFQDGNLLGRVHAYDRATGALAWNVAADNLNDGRLARLGRRVISFGYSGGRSYDPATGASEQLAGAFHWLHEFAYADSTFYQWVDVGGGESALRALRDVTPPALQAAQPADRLVTANASPVFGWTVDDGRGTGVASVELLREGQAPIGLGASSGTYAPPALPDGVHRWRLRARDHVGNTTVTGERTLTVDTTAPSPFALRAPVGGAVLGDPRPALQWEPAADATAVTYRVTLDGAVIADAAACGGATCSLPVPSVLGDGAHSWSVTAVDAAGNVRDSGPGAFSVSAGPTGTLAASAAVVPTGVAVELMASFADPNGPIASYEWDLDGDGSFETRTAGDAPRSIVRFATVGTRTLRVRATDGAGHAAAAGTQLEVRQAAPQGELGMSIDGGAIATNRRDVQLTVVWPRLATEVLISNDGGFGAAGATTLFPIAQTIPWTLASSGPERLPKTVYLRFRGGDAGRETYTDDIILDERAPELTSVAAVAPPASAPAPVAAPRAGAESRRAARRTAPRRASRRALRRFRVRARDANSGVSAVQVSLRRSTKGAVTVRVVRTNARGKRRYAATVKAKLPAGRAWVRVLDAAGNVSKWRRAR